MPTKPIQTVSNRCEGDPEEWNQRAARASEPNRNSEPKKIASPAVPTTGEPVRRSPRFFSQSRIRRDKAKRISPQSTWQRRPCCILPQFSRRQRADSQISRRSASLTWLTLVIVCGLFATRVDAGDWPQLLGPHRDASARGERLPATLPAQLRVRWQVDVGQGYAGPAVVGDRVVVFHRIADQDRLEAFHRTDGRSLWQNNLPAQYAGGIDSDKGPRCVPTIAGSSVIVMSAAGTLTCADLETGTTRWTRDLLRDFKADEGYFGAGSAPIVVDDLVLINVGGEQASGIVALQLRDGRTRWQALDDRASYSSPIVVPHATPPQVAFVTRLRAVIVDANNGKVLFEHPFGRRGPTVNAAAPVAFGHSIFFTANYGVGAMLWDWDGAQGKVVWENDDSLSSQYNTPVEYGGFLYGIHGREDVGQAALRCIEASTGRVAWTVPDFGVAHLLRVDAQVIVLHIDGTLQLGQLDPKRWIAGPRVRFSEHTTRALPALSGGTLFVRDQQPEVSRLFAIALETGKN